MYIKQQKLKMYRKEQFFLQFLTINILWLLIKNSNFDVVIAHIRKVKNQPKKLVEQTATRLGLGTLALFSIRFVFVSF